MKIPDRSNEVYKRLRQIEPIYDQTVEDAVVDHVNDISETMPINSSLQLGIQGFYLPPYAAGSFELLVGESVDRDPSTISVRLGYDDLSEQICLTGLTTKMRHTDGVASISRVEDTLGTYMLSKTDASTPGLLITEAVDKTYVDSIFHDLEIDAPMKTTAKEVQAWGKNLLEKNTVIAWNLKQSMLLHDDIIGASSALSGEAAAAMEARGASEEAITQKARQLDNISSTFTINKEIGVSPLRSGRTEKDMRAVTHEITVDTEHEKPLAHRTILMASTLRDTNTSMAAHRFDVMQQTSLGPRVETPLSVVTKQRAMLLKYLHILAKFKTLQ